MFKHMVLRDVTIVEERRRTLTLVESEIEEFVRVNRNANTVKKTQVDLRMFSSWLRMQHEQR